MILIYVVLGVQHNPASKHAMHANVISRINFSCSDEMRDRGVGRLGKLGVGTICRVFFFYLNTWASVRLDSFHSTFIYYYIHDILENIWIFVSNYKIVCYFFSILENEEIYSYYLIEFRNILPLFTSFHGNLRKYNARWIKLCITRVSWWCIISFLFHNFHVIVSWSRTN